MTVTFLSHVPLIGSPIRRLHRPAPCPTDDPRRWALRWAESAEFGQAEAVRAAPERHSSRLVDLVHGQQRAGGQDRVQVLASAEVSGQGPPVLQVADAVLDADPLRRMGPAFGLLRRDESGRTG
jgi:hypothetical protein